MEHNNDFINNEQNNINYTTVNNHEGNFAKRQYNKHQMSIMSWALSVAGFGLLAIGLIGFGFLELIKSASVNLEAARSLQIFVPIVSICSILSFILCLVWCFKMQNASLIFQLLTLITYCVSTGFSLGGAFYYIEVPEIIFAFAITGLAFFLTFFIAKIMSIKSAMNLGKITMILFFVYLILIFISIILNAFSFIPTISQGYNSIMNNWIYTIITSVSGVLTILFLIYNLWAIQNMDKFNNYLDNKQIRNIGMFFGLMILMNLIRILFFIIRMLINFRSN